MRIRYDLDQIEMQRLNLEHARLEDRITSSHDTSHAIEAGALSDAARLAMADKQLAAQQVLRASLRTKQARLELEREAQRGKSRISFAKWSVAKRLK